MRLEIPIDAELAGELLGFWRGIFGDAPDIDPRALVGHEAEYNAYCLYLTRRGDRLAGTCMTTIARGAPSLGGFGEVATAPEFRGAGIATGLCGQAVDDFRGTGGEALFLGTGNPGAARIYHRLGWRMMAGTNVMANISSRDSPEAYLVDYFREKGHLSVAGATPSARIPMIPLLVTPHDWQVLDANVLMYSSRYCVQKSCNGLYPKYQALTERGMGTWFVAYSGEGRAVGLSTARLDGSGGCQVDGFTHKDYGDAWERLLRLAAEWGETRGPRIVWAAVSNEDEEKRAMLETMGFQETGPAEEFDLDGSMVGAVRMELS